MTISDVIGGRIANATPNSPTPLFPYPLPPSVVALVCGVSGSKSIHLTVTYPTRRTWMDAAPRLLGGGF